jgi:predicted O-methyltransferase YrrM
MKHYPSELNVKFASKRVVDLYQKEQPDVYVEVGAYEGYTAQHILKHAKDGAKVYLLDFAERAPKILNNLTGLVRKEVEVFFVGNSDLMYDSYNWSLSLMIDEGVEIDFAFIDGAHTLAHDGLAFALIDVMLKPGGVVCFDDYDWSIDRSGFCNGESFAQTDEQYTPDQQRDLQVERVVRQLVRTRDDYEEIIPDFAFRKKR